MSSQSGTERVGCGAARSLSEIRTTSTGPEVSERCQLLSRNLTSAPAAARASNVCSPSQSESLSVVQNTGALESKHKEVLNLEPKTKLNYSKTFPFEWVVLFGSVSPGEPCVSSLFKSYLK